MGALTRADYQTRVMLALGNWPSAHPLIAAGIHTTAINNAPNKLIRDHPELFPEHQDNSWTIGPNIVGDNRVALPENLLVIDRVHTNALATTPSSTPGDWSDYQEQLVAPLDVEVIGLQVKTSTTTGYPQSWARKANDLLYYPTTQTDFTCYFRVYGGAGEIPLAAAGSTFRMHRDFDTAIIFTATSDVFTFAGQYDKAEEMLGNAQKEVDRMLGVMTRENARRTVRIRIAGMPR